MKYFLKTTYPCLIKISNQIFELESFDTLEIEDEQYLFVYPEKHLYPFYINLKNPIENEHFSILKHDGKTFLVLEGEKNFNTQEKEKIVANGKICFVSIGEGYISFETESRKTTAKILSSKDYQISKINNFAVATFKKEIFAFNIENEKLSHFSGDNISLENKIIKVQQTIFPEQKQRLSTYEIGQSISLIEDAFSDEKDTIKNSELLPISFLKCVKTKDYDCAISKLSENLKGQITKENLSSFFGNFNSFLPLGTQEFITISSDKKNFVKFSIKNDKVEDILIDEL